jgi:hypothetical protein
MTRRGAPKRCDLAPLMDGWITPRPNELVVDAALAGIHDVLLPSTVLRSPTPHRRLGAMSGVTGAVGVRGHPQHRQGSAITQLSHRVFSRASRCST